MVYTGFDTLSIATLLINKPCSYWYIQGLIHCQLLHYSLISHVVDVRYWYIQGLIHCQLLHYSLISHVVAGKLNQYSSQC